MSAFGDQVRAYKATVARIVPGLTPTDVRTVLGEPDEILPRASSPTPSDQFHELGSVFQFADADADVVWVYRDPLRPRFRQCVAFKDDAVHARWREARES